MVFLVLSAFFLALLVFFAFCRFRSFYAFIERFGVLSFFVSFQCLFEFSSRLLFDCLQNGASFLVLIVFFALLPFSLVLGVFRPFFVF